MKTTCLGSTGLRVHPLVFGTLPLGPLQAALPLDEGARIIRTALEMGVNLLDTAELYQNYPYIRAALEGYAGQAYVATKTHAQDAATARAHVEKALRELGCERLDIVHLHGARLADPFVEREAVFAELVKLRDEGKIAHLGLSTHYIAGVEKALAQPEVDVIHPLINRAGMGILDGTAAQMAASISRAAQAGKGVYAMKALAGGNLISAARQSIAYVMGLPGVDALALGMLSTEEVEANFALLSGAEGDAENWARLERKRRRIKVMDQFCKGCGACIPACTNHGLSLVDGRVAVDEERCILCGYCAAACPEFLIRVV